MMDSQGTVHRCLVIPEVINLICGEVSNSLRGRKTLTTLARTCRLFHGSALDYLWSEISTIALLVKCMPSDLWREEPIRGRRRLYKLSISRPIMPSDWPRFIMHATRVKKFRVESGLCAEVGVQVYQALSVAARTPVLLPNVRNLAWSPEDDAVFPYISLFLGPKIIAIHLSVKNCEVVGHSLLPTLCSRYPSLRYFDLYDSENSVAATKVLSVTLSGWTQLRELRVGELIHSALIHVGRLPHLSNLSCILVRDSMPDAIPSSPNFSWFPALSSLFIKSEDLTACTFLMEKLSSAPLDDFTLTHYGSLGWRRLLDAIGRWNPSTLSLVELKDIKWETSDHDTNILTVGNIRPLFTFSNLCSVELCPKEGIDLDDTDMEELARAWPQLSSLTLRTRHTTQRKPRVTLAGLIPLAKYCRKLSSLILSVNACEVAISESRPAKGIDHRRLEILGIGDSPIEDPIAVAAFLSDFFPAVTGIYTFDEYDYLPIDAKWDQVGELISTFASIRSQERNYYECGDETSGDDAGDDSDE